nr:unnamed protein product [Callosobruchus analis]
MVVNKFTNMQTQPNFNSMRRMFVPRKVSTTSVFDQ